MKLSTWAKTWIKYRAKKYAERNWYQLLCQMHDGDSNVAAFAKAFTAGARFGMQLAEEEFLNRSQEEDEIWPPKARK